MQKLIRILSGIGFVIFSIIFVVFLSGWWDNDPKTTSEDVGPGEHRATSGPSITELEDETKLLDELIATDACVFAFSGTFLQVWLEYEVKEGDSKESKVFSTSSVAITRP